nr:peptidase [Providencia stuartii]
MPLIVWLVMLLSSCTNIQKEYVPQPQMAIPAYLLDDCLPPIIPLELTWGDSLLLNETLLTIIEQCNLDKQAIRVIEQQRHTLFFK